MTAPPQWAIDRVFEFDDTLWNRWGRMLDDVSKLGVITSWWRSPERNDQVGGDSESQHLLGTALDIVPRGETSEAIEAAAAGEGFQVVVEREHIHIQAWPAGSGPERSEMPQHPERGAPRRHPSRDPLFDLPDIVTRNGVPGCCDESGVWRPL